MAIESHALLRVEIGLKSFVDSRTRSRLVRWLFILGPTASLILFALGTWLMIDTRAGEALQSTLTRASASGPFAGVWPMPSFAFAAIGWLLLTLGCSAGTCLRLFRQRGKTGRALVVFVLLGTPLLAFAQVVLAVSIVVGGCLAIAPIRS